MEEERRRRMKGVLGSNTGNYRNVVEAHVGQGRLEH